MKRVINNIIGIIKESICGHRYIIKFEGKYLIKRCTKCGREHRSIWV